MQTDSPKKFKFFLQHFRPKAYSSTSLLKKLRPKVRSLVIPLKGSSSFGDYVLTDILKHPRQLPPSSFKTLQKLKTWFLSDEFLQFFINNKQILKNIRAFKANINNFSHKRARLFTTFLNRMSNLNKFDDTAKLCVQKPQVQPKALKYTFPGRNTLRTTGRGELSPKPAAIGVLLKNLCPLRKVQEVRFTPNLDFKRLFPMVKRLEIEACYLEKLPIIKGKKVEELRITDNSCEETVVLPEKEVMKELEKFKALKKVTVEISDEDNIEVLEVVKYLPKQEITVQMNCHNSNEN